MTGTGASHHPKARVGTRRGLGIRTSMGEMYRQKKSQKNFAKRMEVCSIFSLHFLESEGIREGGAQVCT